MKTLVINLRHRSDRLETFQKNWNWLEYEICEGIIHDVPHTGCGLAHLSAIKKGLEKNDWCLILEDDAILNCSQQFFLQSISKATKNPITWDAIFLGAQPHYDFCAPLEITYVNELFFQSSRTKSLRNCTGMLWSKQSLPFLREYEKILSKNHIFPIDRALTSFSYPWKKEEEFWDEEKNFCFLSKFPIVWICKKCLINQLPSYSDNERKISCFENDNDTFLTELFMRGLQEQKTPL